MSREAGPSDADIAREALRVCPCLHVRRAARAVTRLFDNLLEPVGVRSTQFVLLAALLAEGEMRLPKLADELSLDRSALTRALRPLEEEGLVRRAAGSTGRASSVKLTSRGRQLVRKAVPLWKQGMDTLLGATSVTRYERMVAELDVLTRASAQA